MEVLFYFFVFIFGAIIGSFLNVVILRYKTGVTLCGRSFCFSCGKTLRARDLIPLASFAVLGGKCRFCKAKISWQYVSVEAATGILFALLFWKFGGAAAFLEIFGTPAFFSPYLLSALFYLTAFSLALIIVVYDIKHKIIPDAFSYGFAVMAFVRLAFFPFVLPSAPTAWDFLAGPLLALFLAGLWYFTKGRGIGLGDAKLMLGLGWFLGALAGFAALVLSFWIGAAVALALLAWEKTRKRKWFGGKITMKTELPFAPFLCLAFFTAVFFPPAAEFVSGLFFK